MLLKVSMGALERTVTKQGDEMGWTEGNSVCVCVTFESRYVNDETFRYLNTFWVIINKCT